MDDEEVEASAANIGGRINGIEQIYMDGSVSTYEYALREGLYDFLMKIAPHFNLVVYSAHI